MDTMTPVYSAGTLLIIAAVAVAVLLVLIIALRMHAFVALVLVSFGTAVAAGVPVAEVPTIAIAAFGSTLGTVALLVGLGVMIGRLLEVTGGAQVLADTLVNRFGEKRAPLALGIAALLFGLPIFFDAGLVVFLPIIFSVAKRFGGSVLMYALPAAGAFAAMHAIVPPHPGPVTAATEIDASIGLTLLIGVVVAVVCLVRRRVRRHPRVARQGLRPDRRLGADRRPRGRHRQPAGVLARARHPAPPARAHRRQHGPHHAASQRHDRRGRRPGSTSSSSSARRPWRC